MWFTLQEGMAYLIIATTKIVNGQTLVETFMEKLGWLMSVALSVYHPKYLCLWWWVYLDDALPMLCLTSSLWTTLNWWFDESFICAIKSSCIVFLRGTMGGGWDLVLWGDCLELIVWVLFFYVLYFIVLFLILVQEMNEWC